MKTLLSKLLVTATVMAPAALVAQTRPVAVPVTNTVRIVRPAGAVPTNAAVRPGPGQFAPVAKPPAGPFLNDADGMAPLTPAGGGTAAIGAPRATRKAETVAEALKDVDAVIAGQSGTNTAARPLSLVPPDKDLVIDAGGVNFPGMPVEQILELYGEWTGRTMLIGQGVNKQLTLDIVSNEDLRVSEVIQAFDIVLNQNQITIVPIGDKFLLAVGSAQAIKEGQPFTEIKAENMPESPTLLTKIIQLQYAEPKDVVNVIQKFAKVAGGITQVESTKTIIIQEFAINMKRMLELVAKIDVPAPANEQVFEVIPILYAPVSEVADMLGNFTEGGSAFGSARTTGSGARSSSGSRSSRGSSSSRSTVNNTLGGGTLNNRVGNNFRTQQAAAPTPATPGSAANSFQQRLRSIVANAAGEDEPEPLLGKARIGYYERSNSLLVRGTRDELVKVKELVAKLDTVQPQVLIEGIIMDVSLTDNFQFGINILQSQTGVGGNRQIFGGVNNSGGVFGSSLTNSLANAISSIPGGFSYYGLLGRNWETVVRAVETDTFATVLSRPQILTTHAEPASLFVGENVPYPASSGLDFSGNLRTTIQSVDVGITLDILPLINPDGLVILEIEQSIDSVREFRPVGDLSAPVTTRRNASSKIAVNSGETIILGGMITSNKARDDTGTPFLRNIPVLGNLFKRKSKDSSRSELIIMLRPTVLKTPELVEESTRLARQKLPGVRRAEMEIEQEDKAWLKRIEDDEKAMLQKATNATGQVKGKWDLPIDMFEVVGGR